MYKHNDLGMDHYFFIGGGGLPFLGLADNFFQRVMRFKQFFFITFCNENNFFTTIFKKCYRLLIDLIRKKNTSCACIHMKVSSE